MEGDNQYFQKQKETGEDGFIEEMKASKSPVIKKVKVIPKIEEPRIVELKTTEKTKREKNRPCFAKACLIASIPIILLGLMLLIAYSFS